MKFLQVLKNIFLTFWGLLSLFSGNSHKREVEILEELKNAKTDKERKKATMDYVSLKQNDFLKIPLVNRSFKAGFFIIALFFIRC